MSEIAHVKITLGRPGQAAVSVDGHAIENIVHAVDVTLRAGDLPHVGLELLADLVEIEGQAEIAARLIEPTPVGRYRGSRTLDITPISSRARRLRKQARPSSFWRLHLHELREILA